MIWPARFAALTVVVAIAIGAAQAQKPSARLGDWTDDTGRIGMNYEDQNWWPVELPAELRRELFLGFDFVVTPFGASSREQIEQGSLCRFSGPSIDYSWVSQAGAPITQADANAHLTREVEAALALTAPTLLDREGVTIAAFEAADERRLLFGFRFMLPVDGYPATYSVSCQVPVGALEEQAQARGILDQVQINAAP